MANLSLAFDILARDKASPEIDRVSHSLGRAAAAGSFFGTIAGSVVAKGLGLIGDAARAAVGEIGKSVNAASDLAESVSKAANVFGPAAAEVEAFADTAAEKLGQSKQQALEATSTFGNLFTAMGIGKAPAADLSVSLDKLASDLASFNNTSVDDALVALQSGLLGEAEPLRKYGVTLSAARIEAEAFAIGLVKPVASSAKLRDAQTTLAIATEKSRVALQKHGKDSVEAVSAQQRVEKSAEAVSAALKGTVPQLTAAQKAQAAYSIVMKDTTTAQGDFGRTAGGLANETRTLQARLKNLEADIGNALLPTITELAEYANSTLVPAITDFIKGMEDGTGKGGEFAATLSDLAGDAKSAYETVKPLISFVFDHIETFAKIAVGVVAMNLALKVTAGFTSLRGLLFGIAAGEEAVGAAGATAAGQVGLLRGALAGVGGLAGLTAVLGGVGIYEADKYERDHPSGFYRPGKTGEDPWAGLSSAELEKQAALFKDSKTQQDIYSHILDLIAAKRTTSGPSSLADSASDDPKHARVASIAAKHASSIAAAAAAAGTGAAVAGANAASAYSAALLAGAAKAREAAKAVAQAAVDGLKSQFDQAKGLLEQAIADNLALKKQLASSILQGSSLSDVFGSGPDLNANGAFGKRDDFGKIRAFFAERLRKTRTFVLELQSLLKKGLSPSLVAEIASQGIESGGRIAAGLQGASSGQLGQLNAFSGELSKLANIGGKSVADATFAKQIAADQKNTYALAKRLDAANASLARIDGNIAASVGRTTASGQRLAAAAGGG